VGAVPLGKIWETGSAHLAGDPLQLVTHEKKRKEKKRKEKKRKEKKRKEKKRKGKKRKEKKRKEKKRKDYTILDQTTPFGINLMESQVLHRAAQACDPCSVSCHPLQLPAYC